MQNAGSPRRNFGVCAPKQELHAYPFILENPCRSERRPEIPYTYPARPACNGLPHIWGCLSRTWLHLRARACHIFSSIWPVSLRLTMAFCEIRHYANISSGKFETYREPIATQHAAAACSLFSPFAVPFISRPELSSTISPPLMPRICFSAIVLVIVWRKITGSFRFDELFLALIVSTAREAIRVGVEKQRATDDILRQRKCCETRVDRFIRCNRDVSSNFARKQLLINKNI